MNITTNTRRWTLLTAAISLLAGIFLVSTPGVANATEATYEASITGGCGSYTVTWEATNSTATDAYMYLEDNGDNITPVPGNHGFATDQKSGTFTPNTTSGTVVVEVRWYDSIGAQVGGPVSGSYGYTCDSDPPVDSDGDGVSDAQDECPGTPSGTEVDEVGCEVIVVPPDSDGDGVPDAQDQCPGTAPGTEVDEDGCEVIVVPPDVNDDPNGTVPHSDEANQEEFWEARLGDGSECVKTETSQTPYELGAPPEGYAWTLLVIKSGSGADANAFWNDPSPGKYQHPSGKTTSHVVVCKKSTSSTTTTVADTTTTTVADTTTTTVADTTTTVAETTTTVADTTTTAPKVTTTTKPPKVTKTKPNTGLGDGSAQQTIGLSLIALATGLAALVLAERRGIIPFVRRNKS